MPAAIGLFNFAMKITGYTYLTVENTVWFRMIDMNVDNIITDNIELAQFLLAESKSSDIVNEFLKMLR